MENPADQFELSKQEFTPMEFVYRNLKYLPWIALSLIVSIIGALIYLRYTPDEFMAKGQMIIKGENAVSTSDEKFNRLFLMDAGPNLNNEMAILKSNNFVQRVVQELGLNFEYTGLGKVKSTLGYPHSPLQLEVIRKRDSSRITFQVTVLNDKEFLLNGAGEARQFGSVIEDKRGVFKIHLNPSYLDDYDTRDFLIDHYPLDIAAERIIPHISIKQSNEYANILEISFQSTNVQQAADIVNTLMKEYGNATVEDKNAIALGTIRFIDERLDSLQSELSGVEGAIQQFQEKNQGIGLGLQSEMYVNSMSELDTRINDISVKKKVLQWLKEYLLNKNNDQATVPVNLGVDEPTLTALISAYNELQLQKTALLKSTTLQNPKVLEMQASLDKIKIDINEALASVDRSYDIVLKQMQDRYSSAQQKSVSVPGKVRRLLNIERQHKIKEELYLLLLSKKEEVAIASAAVLPNSSILEKATVRGKLVAPIPSGVYLKFIAAGLAIPILIIMVLGFLNDKISMRSDIEKNTQVPIAGEVGSSDNPSPLLVTLQNRSYITEQFRSIRTNMTYLANQTSKPTILVTSSMSGEGKSFISTNIGAAFALAGKKTLLLEFDIRKPKISSNLNVSTRKGLSSYLVTNEKEEDLLVRVKDIDGLYVFPCGVIPPNPSEMLLLPKMEKLFAWAKENFDVIIIDSAPVGVVSDAITLGKYADATLYIIRQNYTIKKVVDLIDTLYQTKRLPSMSVVINDVQMQRGYGYGYGYGYAFGKGQQASGYFDINAEPKKSFWKRLFGNR
ncbi:tyrosine-protein kinase [Flavihumibacter cheonanensis]|uniref:GumC family protein n=1 Tax=Flavihumibacter cheonanensis TaxID=1442385 RepID=UPI001EF79B37|nr:tyrosine-protein kinase [Flavihumibacter cheonanensis]MCG7753918.1 polysaccharide biosynthesis tyrosine autokinase [Flavihumibacter cheonanensis]